MPGYDLCVVVFGEKQSASAGEQVAPRASAGERTAPRGPVENTEASAVGSEPRREQRERQPV